MRAVEPSASCNPMKEFTIYNPTTGECYSGSCFNDADAENQPVPAGWRLWLGEKCDRIADKVVMNRGQPQRVKRDALEIAARRPAPQPHADPVDTLVEILKRKGIDITPADVAEAKQTTRNRK